MDIDAAANAEEPHLTFQDHLAQLLQLITRIEEDDMVNRQKRVLDRLATIRVGKRKILDHLQILMDKDIDPEDKSAEFIDKLIHSYNGLKNQEEEFSSAMDKIIDNNKRALDEMVPKIYAIQQKITEEAEQQQIDENADEEEANPQEESIPEMEKLLVKLTNMKEMISGIGGILKEAVDSSKLLDEHLKTRLTLYLELKKKSLIVQQLQKKVEAPDDTSGSAQRTTATTSANVNSNSDRKQRQLERLRREAARRGLRGEENSGSSSKSSAVNKEKSNQAEAESKSELQLEESQRIPPIPELPKPEPHLDNSEKKKHDLRIKISERFSSIEARKLRMRQIQAKLSNLQQKKMEHTYEDALKRFRNLTEMRLKLEDLHLQEILTNPNGKEEVQQAQQQDKNENDGPTAKSADEDSDKNMGGGGTQEATQQLHDSDDIHSSASTNELLNEVRRAFNEAFEKDNKSAAMAGTSIDSQMTGNMPGSSSLESAFSSLGDRLKVIENVLHNHTDQLIWIGNQSDEKSTAENEPRGEPHQQEISDAEENGNKSNQAVTRAMVSVVQFFEEQFGQDGMGTVDTDSAKKLVALIIDHTCSPEDRQKMGQSLPTIIEDLMSKYYRQEFRAIQQQLTAELTEALENEFAFLFLIRDANALTT